MAAFALLYLLPLAAYLLVQTIRDYRAKQVLLCLWGVGLLSLTLFLITDVFKSPGY